MTATLERKHPVYKWNERREQKRRNDAKVIASILSRLANGMSANEFSLQIQGLTLPGNHGVWERRLAEAAEAQDMKIHVLGIERDPEVLDELQRKIPGIESEHRNLTMSTVAAAQTVGQTLRGIQEPQPFDFVYLDYMGNWAEDKKEDLRLLFARSFLKAGSVLALTFCLKRGEPAALQECKKLAVRYPITHTNLQAPAYNTLSGYRPPPKPRNKDGSKRPAPVTKSMMIHGIPASIVKLAAAHGVTLSSHYDIDGFEYSNDNVNRTPMIVFVFSVLATKPVVEIQKQREEFSS